MNLQGESFGARFGQLVRHRRGLEGLTQEELAARAFPGGETSASLISLLENGQTARPQQKTVDALATALDLKAEDVAACRNPDSAILHDLKTTLEGQQAAFAEQRSTLEDFLALLSNTALIKRAEKRGLTLIQIENLLKRFGHAGAPVEQAEQLLLDAADQFDKVRARLALLSESEPSVREWKASALKAIAVGDLDYARRLFAQAADRDLEAVREIEASRRERRLNASDSIAQIARLESAEAAFPQAAKRFEAAARIAEPVDIDGAWWHWVDAAAAYARGAEVFPDITASRAAVEIIRRHSLPLAIATNNQTKLQRARYELAEDLLALANRVPEEEASMLRREALVEGRLALEAALPLHANLVLRMTGLAQVGDIELAIARATAGLEGVASGRAAVAAYREAVALVPAECDCWARLGMALRALSDRVGEPEASLLLDEAIMVYRTALDHVPGNAPTSDRANLSSLLGAAYVALADKAGPNLRNDHLQTAKLLFEEAVTALDTALQPLSWAQAMGNVAMVERRLAIGPDRVELLQHVIARYRAILTIYSRKETAEEWGRINNNLGAALIALALDMDGATAISALHDAISAFEDSLSVRPRIPSSLRHSRVQNNLGLAYWHLAQRLAGEEALGATRKSIEKLEAALASRSKETEPLDWAGASVNLALSEGLLAELVSDAQLKKHAQMRIDEAIVLFEKEEYSERLEEARQYRAMLEDN